MISAQVIVTVLITLTALAFSGERALSRIRNARARYKSLMLKRQQQVERIRKVARESLDLRRELQQIQRTVKMLDEDWKKLDTELKRVTRPENRLFVFDERRLAHDSGWVVVVTAPPGDAGTPRPKAPWTGNRRYLVWAADEEAAQAKVFKRFAPADGFAIASVTKRARQEQQKRATS